jgi:hypothetical protein
MSKLSMKWLAAAALVAALGGCAIVPYGPPPVYIGVHADGGGHGYGRGYDRGGYSNGGYYNGGYYRGGRY